MYWKGIVVTFVAYVCVHAGRKALTNTKAIAAESLGLSPEIAGSLDAVFMLAYAAGLVFFGGLGDKFSPSKLLSVSLISMAVLQLVFAVMCVARFGESVIGCVGLFAVWIVNGAVQSLAWPCCIKLVRQCMCEGASSTVFSVWACNGVVGNILCSVIASFLVELPGKAGFVAVFLVTSLCNQVAMLLVQSASFPAHHAAHALLEETTTSHPAERMSLEACLKIPGVIDYSACHAFVKGVAYAMFFWLPFYLVKVHGISPGAAAAGSIWYDLATLVGGPVCGYLVEKTKKPALVISVFVLLAAGPQFFINSDSTSLAVFSSSIPRSVLVNLLLSGFFVGGVLNVLSAAVCSKLGGEAHTSMVTGVIDGLGSLGASATQVLVPFLGVDSGWGTVFSLLGVMLVLSAVTLVRVTRDELKQRPEIQYQIQN